MKKRYFHALLALLVAVWLLPQSMRADSQCYVELAVNDNKTFDDENITYTLTFKYGEKPSSNTTKEKYFDLTATTNGYPSWLGYAGSSSGDVMIPEKYTYASKVKTATLETGFTTNFGGTTCASWFQCCSTMTEIAGIENLNTTNVTDMSNMFYRCYALTSLDVSNFNTAKVVNMYRMFTCCKVLTSLDLRSFNTAEVTSMHYMFYNCKDLASIHVDLLNWTTNKVTNSSNMFNSCTSLPNYSSVSDYTAKSCNTLLTYHFKDTYDGTALSSKLSSLNGTTLQSVVLDRTMPTTTYGTICLPVALTAAQVTSTFGSGTIVKSLTGATYDSNNNRLTLTFTNVTSSGMTAGKPYLIKSAKTDPETITGATIGATTGGSTEVINSLCQMHGVLSPYELAASENNLFVSNGTLYYSTGGTMNGMRAYFTLHGNAATAAESLARPRAVISPDDDSSETGILSINADGSLTYEETGDWYTLGGMKLSGKPATKGMYILNGKKYIVK